MTDQRASLDANEAPPPTNFTFRLFGKRKLKLASKCENVILGLFVSFYRNLTGIQSTSKWCLEWIWVFSWKTLVQKFRNESLDAKLVLMEVLKLDSMIQCI